MVGRREERGAQHFYHNSKPTLLTRNVLFLLSSLYVLSCCDAMCVQAQIILAVRELSFMSQVFPCARRSTVIIIIMMPVETDILYHFYFWW